MNQLAPRDWRAAYDAALTQPDPWRRAQSLGWVARFAGDTELLRIAREALQSATAAEDPFQRVAAAAWPIRALIERGYRHEAQTALNDVLPGTAQITNPVNAVDALFLLWQAVHPLEAQAREIVLKPLLRAASVANSWKPQRVLQLIVLMTPPSERSVAEAVLRAMSEGKYRRAAARQLEAGEHQDPRPFFWTSAA